MSYRNGEGYRDPTAEKAIRRADKEREEQRQVKWLLKTLYGIAEVFDYEIVGKIVLRKKKRKDMWR